MSFSLRVEGKQNSLFPVEQVIKCFVISPNSKIEKNYVGVFFPLNFNILPKCE